MSLEAAGHLPEMFPDSGGEAGEALGLRVPPGLLHLPGQTTLTADGKFDKYCLDL